MDAVDEPVGTPDGWASGASASGAQGASASSSQGALASGAQGTEELSHDLTLKENARGFQKNDHGVICLVSGWASLKSWAWLIGHRQRILDTSDSAPRCHHG